MELLNITSDTHFLVSTSPEETSFNSFSKTSLSKNALPEKTLSYNEEQEKYYKESIIINYQRYKALFRSKLISNILIDDKNIVRDLNKKAKDDFGQILGMDIKIGASLAALFKETICVPAFQKALHSSMNELMEFEMTDEMGEKHLFQIEIILFVSPLENSLLKCISAVKIG